MRLQFLGGAGEVTGSCYLLETDRWRALIDCGMFQGGRDADRKNREALQFDPRSIDFVLLTHAHIDHSGLLPRLAALGFRGPIYATKATAELLQVMLIDSAHIHENEAERHNRHWHRKRPRSRRELAPLYTVTQAQACMRQVVSTTYDVDVHPAQDLRVRFRDAGHILGSAILEIWITEQGKHRKLVCSGDLGQPSRPILRDPAVVSDADVLLVESTYGDRAHKSMEATLDELVAVVDDTLHRKGGNVIVPAFAVGRAQEVLYLLAHLVRQQRLGKLHVYVDSPMALQATEITLKHTELLDPETLALLAWSGQRDGPLQVRFVQDVQESIALNRIRAGAVIISASGMCDAGRIRHHLRHNLGRRECAILITGFQAQGTLGRRLVDGAKRVRIDPDDVPVRASIHTLGGLSAHADQRALIAWLQQFKRAPEATYLVHGEPGSAAGLLNAISAELGWPRVEIAQAHQVVALA